MKTIIDTIIANGGEPQVTQSIFVFLKFISSVVPTIQYDFTVDLELEWIKYFQTHFAKFILQSKYFHIIGVLGFWGYLKDKASQVYGVKF